VSSVTPSPLAPKSATLTISASLSVRVLSTAPVTEPESTVLLTETFNELEIDESCSLVKSVTSCRPNNSCSVLVSKSVSVKTLPSWKSTFFALISVSL